ncbi:MAG: dCTP deaminase [Chitinophagaceae bacterium]|nr:dCTP deaminase [Chitinophagaceae bacterium]
MSNAKQLLLLHLAHAKQALDRARNNSYSDQRKETYQSKLSQLLDGVDSFIQSNLTTLTDSQIYDGPKIHLDFIIKSLQFLESSTLNQIPYEIVEALSHTMNEWEGTDKFIIVTSLINDAEGFSYESWLANDDNLYKDIAANYPAITFDQRLVQINLPKSLVRDYLVAVVLYHELGHFVDLRNSLMSSLVYEVLDKIYANSYTPDELKDLKYYFPDLSFYIDDTSRPDWTTIFYKFSSTFSHFEEYFCDLFAAQYTGIGSSVYVTYLGSSSSLSSSSHPSDINREKIVSDFLSGTPNFIIKLLTDAVKKIKGLDLKKRFSDVDSTDFFNLIPTELNDAQQLHGIFATGWSIWLNRQTELGKKINTTDSTKIYSVINNLIEKSIGNYIAINEWIKVNPQLATVPPAKTPILSVFSFKRKGILTRNEISESISKNKLFIRPLLSVDQIGEASIDFRLGYDFLVSVQGRDAFINASKNEWIPGGHQRNVKQFFQSSRRQIGETFILHPNQTVLGVTLEYVRLPDDCMLMLFMRSSYARLGLTVSTIVQPGYCGCLNVEFTNSNNNPINLAIGARIIQGVICRVSGDTQYFHTPRKYICQVRPEPSSVINDGDLANLNELWKLNNKR